MPSLIEIAKLRSLEEFWKLLADEIKDRAKEDVARLREKAAEKQSEYRKYLYQNYYSTGQQVLTGKAGEERYTAPTIYELPPPLKGFADVDSTGLVTFHIPGTTITVDNAGTVAFGVPGTEFQVTASGQILLNYYQISQQAIAQHAVDLIFQIWDHHINYEQFMKGWDIASELIKTVIEAYHGAAAAHAAQYYESARAAEGFRPIKAISPELDSAQLDKVTHAMGPGAFFGHIDNGNDTNASGLMARDDMGGASARLVRQGGRDTVTATATADPFATGWERIIEPKACSFCAMLAGRGGVYKESTVNFRAHDHCECVARPVFKGQKSINAGLSTEWADATKGTRGKAAIAAWDKYWSDNVKSIERSAQETQVTGPGNAALAGQPERQPAISNQ